MESRTDSVAGSTGGTAEQAAFGEDDTDTKAPILNLTPQERDPTYSDYVEKLYKQLRDAESLSAAENRAPQPESRGFS